MLQGDVDGIRHREPVAFRHVPDPGDQLVLDGPSVTLRGPVDQAVLDAEVTVAQRRRNRLRLLENALGLAHQLHQGLPHFVWRILMAEVDVDDLHAPRPGSREVDDRLLVQGRIGDDHDGAAHRFDMRRPPVDLLDLSGTLPTSMVSPTSNGRSIRSMRPEKRLPSGSCSASPTTIDVTPRAARAFSISRAPDERVDHRQADGDEQQPDQVAQQSGNLATASSRAAPTRTPRC